MKPCRKNAAHIRGRNERGNCLDCNLATTRAWQAANPEKTRSAGRSATKRYLYGIGPEELQAMRDAQHGKCANPRCVVMLSDSENVDHCHVTRKVRALLCGGCNRALGHAKEDPARLRGLALYAEACAELREKVLQAKC